MKDKLIWQSAAIDALDEIEAEVADGYGYQYAKWREYFAKMPAVDAVEVVRCKDCKKFYMKKDIFGKVPWCKAWHRETIETMFCGWGKRKDEKEESESLKLYEMAKGIHDAVVEGMRRVEDGKDGNND